MLSFEVSPEPNPAEPFGRESPCRRRGGERRQSRLRRRLGANFRPPSWNPVESQALPRSREGEEGAGIQSRMLTIFVPPPQAPGPPPPPEEFPHSAGALRSIPLPLQHLGGAEAQSLSPGATPKSESLHIKHFPRQDRKPGSLRCREKGRNFAMAAALRPAENSFSLSKSNSFAGRKNLVLFGAGFEAISVPGRST